MNHLRHSLTAIVSLASFALAQPKVVSIEELPLGNEQQWHQAQFSPTGNTVYYTTTGFRGIWSYSLQDKVIRQITDEPGAGYRFSVAHDESRIAYRTTTVLPTRRMEYQIVIKDLVAQSAEVIDRGRGMSPPTFVNQGIRYGKGGQSELQEIRLTGSDVEVLGIEGGLIAVQNGTTRTLLDPLGTGRYIWPSLSPDRKLIVAHQMERGTFIMNLEGDVVAQLGKRNGPSWTHSSDWIAYMDDRDDGHRILSSEIMMVSADGATTVSLTNTPDVIELFPSCSPVEKKIVFNTESGRIFLLTYTEEP